MELPGGPRQEGDHVTLRCSGENICVVVDGVPVQDVPASAVERSQLLRSFAQAGPGDTSLQVSFTDMERWINGANAALVDEDSILEILNVRLPCFLHPCAGDGAVHLATFTTCRQCGGYGHQFYFNIIHFAPAGRLLSQ